MPLYLYSRLGYISLDTIASSSYLNIPCGKISLIIDIMIHVCVVGDMFQDEYIHPFMTLQKKHGKSIIGMTKIGNFSLNN